MTSFNFNSEKQIYSRLGSEMVTTIEQAIAAGNIVIVDLKEENCQQFGEIRGAVQRAAVLSSVYLTKVATSEAEDV